MATCEIQLTFHKIYYPWLVIFFENFAESCQHREKSQRFAGRQCVLQKCLVHSQEQNLRKATRRTPTNSRLDPQFFSDSDQPVNAMAIVHYDFEKSQLDGILLMKNISLVRQKSCQ